MTNALPAPPPTDLPEPTTGLHTSVEQVLRLVLERIDPSRATPDLVADALHAAGVTVSPAWAADWLDRTREIHTTTERTTDV